MKSNSSVCWWIARACGPVAAAVLVISVLFFAVLTPAPAAAQGGAAPGGPPKPSDADMQKMMALMQPGPNHEALGRLAGHWKTTIKMWMGSAEPTVSEGTAVYEWILDKHYLMNHQTGVVNGMPFAGMGIDGYDNGKGEFFSSWYDNMAPA